MSSAQLEQHHLDLQQLQQVFEPPAAIQTRAHVPSIEAYRDMYRLSVSDPNKFWRQIASEFYWHSKPDGAEEAPILDYNFDLSKGGIYVRWFKGWRTNICYNALDRHVLAGRGDRVAFYWEGNDPEDRTSITYAELLQQVCRFANVLKSNGVKKGDRVAIYMPMVLELVVAMLACARIGAVHSIVFGGFSAGSLADRIINAKCHILITCDGNWRGTKLLSLKSIADKAMSICIEEGNPVVTCLVVSHVKRPRFGSDEADGDSHSSKPGIRPAKDCPVEMLAGRDVWWHEAMAKEDISDDCQPEWLDAEDPLFMLYTSGSTGKPKGVLHTVGGYMVYSATTFKFSFDYHLEDIYWCTADIGWITGHSYVVYGPMANCATSVMFEGLPTWPDAGRCWDVVDKYKVTTFYTAPTAIRTLMKSSDAFVERSSRASLRIIASVGEPINPEAWLWYHRVVGRSQCSVVDTFWQTETGGHVITPLPGATPTKPGSACFPFFGVQPVLLNPETGDVIEGPGEGYLVFAGPWPGIMRTVFGDHPRYEQTYFSKFNGYYTTGDGAQRDKDGYLWVTGRIDDMINVSGHLLSTAQIESALVEHPKVAEAAVVGRHHDVKGESAYAFVTLKDGATFDDSLVRQLLVIVRERIGAFAAPDTIQEAPALPKTRSGKIMRRILREIAAKSENYGDVSTLADPGVIETLVALRTRQV
uniref:acetate--CoA ligase n=1 Tax=Macrostomum lignano TaxID=282301 RepID=A0A1I8JEN4_9PLAT